MNIDEKNIKKTAIALIVFEWVVLVSVFGFFLYQKYSKNVLGVSVMRINKENVSFSPTQELPHFYEWKPYEEIVHERDWLPKTVIANTNSDGLIGSEEYPLKKPEGTLRIIALGDSFTEGPFVEADQTYPAQLEKMLNQSNSCPQIKHYEVLNFGVGGYDIEYSAHRFMTKGLKYRPDLTLWLLKDDDFFDLTEESLKRIDDYTKTIPDDVKNDMTKWEKYSMIDDILRPTEVNLWEKLNNVVRKEMQQDIDQKHYFATQSAALRNVSKSVNSPILLATFEDIWKIHEARMKSWESEMDNITVFKGIPVLDPGFTFEPYDGHPNAKGYEIIAEHVFTYIKEIFLCE